MKKTVCYKNKQNHEIGVPIDMFWCVVKSLLYTYTYMKTCVERFGMYLEHI